MRRFFEDEAPGDHLVKPGDAAIESAPPPPAAISPNWAMATFVILFMMNLLDYIDRWILSAVLPHLKQEFQLSYSQSALLFTYFLVSYSIISPAVGLLGDRVRRTWLLGIGVGIWSLATVGTGFAHSYGQLVLARSLMGIGEATYGSLAPALLMDLFSRDRRARVMSTFYIAMPLGGALGMALGESIANAHGWRWAFWIVGIPSMLAAFSALLVPEPVRGASEGVAEETLRKHENVGARKADYLELLVNSSYNYAVLGMAAYTFAIGGLAALFPIFLTNVKHVDETAKIALFGVKLGPLMLLGATTAAAAIVGMKTGGSLADHFAKVSPRALFIVPGIAMLASIPFVLIAIYSTTLPWIYFGIFFAEALMFVNTGPCNAVIANVVMPNMRVTAYAVSTFVIHFLGDIWSAPLIGWVADTFGQRDAMSTVFGRALAAIGALPTTPPGGKAPDNLTAGMLLVVPAILISGVVLLAGARHVPREMALMLARLKAAPEGAPATVPSLE